MAIFWYTLVPVAGAFISRRHWRVFRRRFDDLRLRPFLDYTMYCQIPEEGGVYRFIGGFESTDGHTLWICSDTLTIPVALANAHTYILPMPEGEDILGPFDPGEEAPERIRWDRVSSLTKGARVFVGGHLVQRENRWVFDSTKRDPLLVIFYDGSDRSITIRTIRAGRHKNEYWNIITPYSFIGGACCQIGITLSFLSRPAFRLTAITAFIALFTPLFPLFPPGILFTILYRQLWRRARIFRAYRDVLRLPLKYISPGKRDCRLPNGERYAAVYYDVLPQGADKIPVLIPEKEGPQKKKHNTEGWYVFGSLPERSISLIPPGECLPDLPQEPQDPFATFGAIPGNPEILAQRYTIKAYTLEIISCFFLFMGIGINIFFVVMIISVLLLQA